MAKILILALEDGAADSLSDSVKEAGWTPVVMHDGSRALSDFSSVSPALVVLDLQIEEGKGIELCRQIRGIDGGDLVPILLIGTGNEGIRNFGDALVEGGDYYFEKPLEISKVISKIRTYVGVDREATTLVAPPPGQESRAAHEKKAPKDLTKKVEHMMDLGEAFKDGLLEPPGEEKELPDDATGSGSTADEEVNITRATAISEIPLERETTLRHKIDPSLVGGLLPPGGKETPEEKDVRIAFPPRLDKIDENFLSPPKETKDDDAVERTDADSHGANVSRLFAEIKEELDSTEDHDEFAEEAQAWSELTQEDHKQAEEKPHQDEAEKARLEAEEKTRREAEEKARLEAEEKTRREAEEKVRLEAEEKSRREAEERARLEAEEKARIEAEEKIVESRRTALVMAHRENDWKDLLLVRRSARRKEEDRLRREAEEKARSEAREEARRLAEKKAQREAEVKARRLAEEKAKREAEEKARRLAEEKAQREAAEKARRLAEEKAQREAEEKARRVTEDKARRVAEETARREADLRDRQAMSRKFRAEVERQAHPTDKGEAVSSEATTAFQKSMEPFGDKELLQAESLWADALQEARTGQVDLVDASDRESRPATTGAGDKLVRLLQREATLAREQAVDEDELDLDSMPTIPGLPPRPGDEQARQPSLASVRAQDRESQPPEDDFHREETADLRPAMGSQQLTSDDDFDEPKTSPILDMRSLAIRSAKNRLRRTKVDQGSESLLDNSGVPVTRSPYIGASDEDFYDQDEVLSEPAPFAACDPARADLAQEMVPALFFRLLSQETTGQVIFKNNNDQKEVFFEGGIPVAVRSTQTADRLEEMLFREGYIDRAAYAEARIKGIGPPRALAAHLVERNLLRPEEYFPLVRRHFEECLLGLFEWTDGQAEYYQDMAPDAEKIRLARSVPWLILEGIRRKFLLDRMVRKLGSPSSLLAAVEPDQRPRQVSDPKSAGFLQVERGILGLVNGLRPIEEIVFLSGQTAITVYRVLLAGVLMGLLTVSIKGIRGSAENDEEILKTNLEIARRRIDAKYDQVNHASYFEILGISETATAYEVEASYRLLSTEFHPMNFAHPALDELAEKLASIRTTLEEARDVLTDDLLRAGYQQSLMNGGK